MKTISCIKLSFAPGSRSDAQMPKNASSLIRPPPRLHLKGALQSAKRDEDRESVSGV